MRIRNRFETQLGIRVLLCYPSSNLGRPLDRKNPLRVSRIQAKYAVAIYSNATTVGEIDLVSSTA